MSSLILEVEFLDRNSVESGIGIALYVVSVTTISMNSGMSRHSSGFIIDAIVNQPVGLEKSIPASLKSLCIIKSLENVGAIIWLSYLVVLVQESG